MSWASWKMKMQNQTEMPMNTTTLNRTSRVVEWIVMLDTRETGDVDVSESPEPLPAAARRRPADCSWAERGGRGEAGWGVQGVQRVAHRAPRSSDAVSVSLVRALAPRCRLTLETRTRPPARRAGPGKMDLSTAHVLSDDERQKARGGVMKPSLE